MTMTAPERGMTPLRRSAEAAEDATGMHAEIIRGVLMMSPAPRGKHAKAINALYDQLKPLLSDELDTFQMAAVALPTDPDDYAIPDLLVCDAAHGDSDDWIVAPGGTELVVEVVSPSSAAKDIRDMVTWYADAGVPAYLVLDPRNGTWTLHSVLRDGAYQGTLHGKYGERVPLDLVRLKAEITTDGLPRYA